MVWFKILRTKS